MSYRYTNTLKNIIKTHGKDLSNIILDWSTIEIRSGKNDYSDIVLPKDKNFFNVKRDGLSWGDKIILPEGDYSGYNFKGKTLEYFVFTPNSKLPNDERFFRDLYCAKCSYCILPKLDLNKYNLDNVSFYSVEFSKGTIFPKDFFKKITYDSRKMKISDVNLGDFEFDVNTFSKNDFSDCDYPKDRGFLREIGIDGAGVHNLKPINFLNYDLDDVCVKGISFYLNKENGIIEDTEVFQKIQGKSLEHTKLPKYNYEGFNFNKVIISNCKFDAESALPKRNDLFQIIRRKSLKGTVMPNGNFSNYNFNGIELYQTKFTEDSILPIEVDLFQNLKNKSICKCEMPNLDYSHYNFKGINIYKTVFPYDSKLPEYKDFLKDIFDTGNYNHIKLLKRSTACTSRKFVLGKYDFQLSRNVIENIANYDLKDVRIDLTFYAEDITESQLNLLRIKYKDLIGSTVFLPKKGLKKDCAKEDGYKSVIDKKIHLLEI